MLSIKGLRCPPNADSVAGEIFEDGGWRGAGAIRASCFTSSVVRIAFQRTTCKLDIYDAIPHHSTFSANRLGRFRESDVLRHIFERVVWSAMAMELVKDEGFAVDASAMEANARRYHGKPPTEHDWTDAQRQKRAVAEFLAAIEAEAAPTNRPCHANCRPSWVSPAGILS